MSGSETDSVQRASATTTVDATVAECYAVAIDIENYPDWTEGIAFVAVESRDEQGRPSTVRFDAEGLGRKATYTLQYDLDAAPEVIAWSLVTGDLVKVIEGRYVFGPAADGRKKTSVEYELSIDLAVPLPGFVKRRAEDKIVDAALRRFKDRVEEISSLS